MTLGFSTKFPDGSPTEFVQKIINAIWIKHGLPLGSNLPPKAHTIRDDPHNRWKPGRRIHFATGVRSGNRDDFAQDVCTEVQQIIIDPATHRVFVNARELSPAGIDELAINDGFPDTDSFFAWFAKGDSGKTRKLIHWTDKRY